MDYSSLIYSILCIGDTMSIFRLIGTICNGLEELVTVIINSLVNVAKGMELSSEEFLADSKKTNKKRKQITDKGL